MLTIRRRGKNFHIRGTIRIGRGTRVIKESIQRSPIIQRRSATGPVG